MKTDSNTTPDKDNKIYCEVTEDERQAIKNDIINRINCVKEKDNRVRLWSAIFAFGGALGIRNMLIGGREFGFVVEMTMYVLIVLFGVLFFLAETCAVSECKKDINKVKNDKIIMTSRNIIKTHIISSYGDDTLVKLEDTDGIEEKEETWYSIDADTAKILGDEIKDCAERVVTWVRADVNTINKDRIYSKAELARLVG